MSSKEYLIFFLFKINPEIVNTYFVVDLSHLLIVCSYWELKPAFVKSRLDAPKRAESIKGLTLCESTYNLCGNERKERLGVKGLANSQFAG